MIGNMDNLGDFGVEVREAVQNTLTATEFDLVPVTVDDDARVKMHFFSGEEVEFGAVPAVEHAEGDAEPEAMKKPELGIVLKLVFPEENSREFYLNAADFGQLEETFEQYIAANMAAAYLLGRLDQINDAEGNNSPRFVRSRHLRKIFEFAGGSSAGLGLEMNRDAILSRFDSLRGSLSATAENDQDSESIK